MPSPVLVAYSTRTGSTGEVAEAIAEVLRQAQLTVEVARMRELKTLGEYSAVILGAPLYVGRIPSEAHDFLNRHRVHLAGLSTWFFVLGPVAGKAGDFFTAGEQAASQLARFKWLRPAEVKIVGGRFDVNRMPFPYSIARYLPAFPLKDAPASDLRDWTDIRVWASKIARVVQPDAQVAGRASLAPTQNAV